MNKENKTSDKQPKGDDVVTNINNLLVPNDLPVFGTKEFNDICSSLFGGNPKSNND